LTTRKPAISVDQIEQAILLVRGQKILLDSDLAKLYGVETNALNKAVKRNSERFPEDFMFQLTAEEFGALRFQIGTLKAGRGQHRKYLPYAFTEQGIAMLSSVLRSPRAVQVNIEIMRAFVRLRHVLAASAELARRVAAHEARLGKHDKQFVEVVQYIQKLTEQPPAPPKPRIGFHVSPDGETRNESRRPKSQTGRSKKESPERR